jgi:hypothetical protein
VFGSLHADSGIVHFYSSIRTSDSGSQSRYTPVLERDRIVLFGSFILVCPAGREAKTTSLAIRVVFRHVVYSCRIGAFGVGALARLGRLS